jgi:8-hydroxy-5-deazaflavin:NADPH oxidoreductase
MRIAVVGTGNMGAGLGRAFARAHQVVLGSRDPEAAAVTAREIGAEGAAPIAEAIRDADVVVLAIPWRAMEETLPQLGDLAGKVVIDISNPYTPQGLRPLEGTSTAEEIQKALPGARVVKGWNHVYAQNLQRPEVDGVAASVLICGDDPKANDVVAGLARCIGFDPVDVGPLASTRHLERLVVVMGGLGLGVDRPLKVLQRM